MNVNILLICDDGDEADYIEDKLLESLGNNVSVKVADSEAQAKEKLEKRAYNLLITNLHKTPLDMQEERGLSLLRSLENEGKRTPCVLLVTAADKNLVDTIKGLSRCDYMFQGVTDWEDELMEKCKKMLGWDVCEQERRLDLDITLDLDRDSGVCSFSGVTEFPMQDLVISGKTLKELADRSKDIKERGSKWQAELKFIGRELMTQIFGNNRRIADFFYEQRGKLGALENIRIRFIVERSVHPLALEALFGRCEACDDYWMLYSPIYRTIRDYPGLRAPLFQESGTREEPINCLIIEADTHGIVDINDNKLNLEELENLNSECNFLEGYLKDNSERFKVGKVGRITKEKVGKRSFGESVAEALQSDTWHLVHYAGHSYYDPNHNEGFVFFPGKFVEKMGISMFSKWLSDANNRFIYLSSCRSSEDDFVFALASQRVPAIIGFRWDIDDDKAEEYTRSFYRHLFEKKSLEYAFLESRKYMHKSYEENLIWAAPMLVIQSKPRG
ncbi:MAG: CHAT domain-containing protein [Promethearchaeota archaeon]